MLAAALLLAGAVPATVAEARNGNGNGPN
ncbi:MAG: hypothetical protein JWM31_2750, partial [Solirubrobacterales bacterium]|nr:hypothetical protein [Solirubrobacterales bacterium]